MPKCSMSSRPLLPNTHEYQFPPSAAMNPQQPPQAQMQPYAQSPQMQQQQQQAFAQAAGQMEIAQGGVYGAPPGSAGGPMGDSGHLPPPTPVEQHDTPKKPTYSKRGKITIVACVPCRKRKTKCDGQRPSCSQCRTRDGSCNYDMTDDQRKLTFLRESVEHLQDKADRLENLLKTIQSSNDEEAAEVFRRLRAGGDLQNVAEQIQAGRMLSGVGSSLSNNHSKGTSHPQLSDFVAATRLSQFESLFHALAVVDGSTAINIIQRVKNNEDLAAILRAVTQDLPAAAPTTTTTPQLLQSQSSPASLEAPSTRQNNNIFDLVDPAEISTGHSRIGGAGEFGGGAVEQQGDRGGGGGV